MGVVRSANPEDTALAAGKTVSDYRALRAGHDTRGIAALVHQRFSERYFVPALWSEHPSGFALLAISCLMIEALESFRSGLADSQRQSERLFCAYFQRDPGFVEFRPKAHDFYKHVRCGILHQGETTGRWRVQRSGLLLEEQGGAVWVNAHDFILRVHQSVQAYCAELVAAAEPDPIWQAAFAKLRAICKHCGVTNLNGL